MQLHTAGSSARALVWKTPKSMNHRDAAGPSSLPLPRGTAVVPGQHVQPLPDPITSRSS